ncbi:MAG: cysteine--tRNA ligase [Proteobacteria bacterium]|nr:cysteine--tRNA ligase [Pseudomonadota bacterium]
MTSHTKTEKADISIAARHRARLLAVQTVYAMDIANFHNTPQVVSSILGNKEAFLRKVPKKSNIDQPYYLEIIKNTEQSLDTLDAAIEPNLATGWRVSRLGTVVRSILRTATCEILILRKTDYPIIINEYLEIAKNLNHAGEAGFINKVLDSISRQLQPAKSHTTETSKQTYTPLFEITLHNSLTRKIEKFVPIDPNMVCIYACGPTVYDRPHLGNMRAAVVYDLLFRLMRECYPAVRYVRNITDVDDKIIAAANEHGVDIKQLTERYTAYYHQDVAALACLPPTVEPRATQHISDMVKMIETLIASKHAYVAQNHVLFSVISFAEYGKLAGRTQEEMIAGARVEVAPYKKNPGDFVLWKPAKPEEVQSSFDSPWGRGRPGWHIECSAMSKAHLGEEFDIHGGGADLMFPHHENEIAQSACANEHKGFARYWIHNGFLTVNGEKMSKSLGNFYTARELLEKGISGTVLRYFYLTTHYRKPLDYSEKAIADAKRAIEKFYGVLHNQGNIGVSTADNKREVLAALASDLNSSKALALLHEYAAQAAGGDQEALLRLQAGCDLLGLDMTQYSQEVKTQGNDVVPEEVLLLAQQRQEAKANKDWKMADMIRMQIEQMGYSIKDRPDNKLEIGRL